MNPTLSMISRSRPTARFGAFLFGGFLLGALLGAAAPAAAQDPAPDPSAPGAVGPAIVLVHGAWGGGWDWRPVDRMLTARGYDVYPRDVPHPTATLREPLELDAPPGAGVRAAYILTREPDREPDGFQGAADRATALGWPVHELEADHNPQKSAREELVRLIERIAGRASGATGPAGRAP